MPRKAVLKTIDPQMELIPVDDLKPNPRNPKRHAGATIGASINRFGMMEPVIRDRRTGYLVAGHGRRDSIIEMRDSGKKPPTGVLVDDTGRWLVPTVTSWASANDNEADAAIVALNRTSEIGGWDDVALFDILGHLSDLDSLTGLGYGDADIDILRRSVEAEGAFTMDFADVIDEFLDETGTGAEATKQYAFRVLRVVFPDEDGAREFFDKLGMAYDDGKHNSIGYPHMPVRRVAEMFDD